MPGFSLTAFFPRSHFSVLYAVFEGSGAGTESMGEPNSFDILFILLKSENVKPLKNFRSVFICFLNDNILAL